MYSQDDIERFLNSSTNPETINVRSEIEKSTLKQLIVDKVNYRHQVIRLLAEICKQETDRKQCVTMNFIALMKETLESTNIREKIESCRAIGNMCYENEEACEMVVNEIGVKTMLDVCRYACQTTGQDGEQLRMMTLGALHNIINSNNKVAEMFFNEEILQIFILYLPYLSESKLILFLFSICSNLIDLDSQCARLVSSRWIFEIGNRLDPSTIYENRKVILPYLLEVCEEDRVKEELCSSTFFYKLLELCEQYADKDDEFVRESCYLLVVLITTDPSIERLLASKEFDLLNYGVSWLERTNLQLKMSGALIITNLTRNDQSARSILTDQRHPDVKLVEQLKHFSQLLNNQFDQMTDEQAKVIHGVLGALRNLAVPLVNRPLLVKNHVLEQVIPYISVKNFSGEIAYKATGVIRFLLRDANDASKNELIEDKTIEKLVENSENLHSGLQFESRRVIFLLPVALKTSNAIESLARNNAFPFITSTMASCDVQSNRGIIQNEALIGLNIIVMFANELICEKLHQASFHENMKQFLGQEIEHPEMMNNFLQLIHLIKKQPNFLSKTQLQEYKPLLENLRVSQNCGGRRLVDRTLAIIQNELD